jgi:hypothetical protein
MDRQGLAPVIRDEPDASPRKYCPVDVEPRARRIERTSSANRHGGPSAVIRLLTIGSPGLDSEGSAASVENWRKTLSRAGYFGADRSNTRQSTENT